MWNKVRSKLPFTLRPMSSNTGAEYLDQRAFLITMAVAFILHMVAMFIWHMSPAAPVVDIPVRVLNIKLGEDEAPQQEAKAPQPAVANSSAVESTLSQLVKDVEPPIAQPAPKIKAPAAPMDKAPVNDSATKAVDKALNSPTAPVSEPAKKLANIAKQFVRTNQNQAIIDTDKKGSKKDAELISRYEQLISLWVEKFKQYPDEARSQGIEGETPVRIRIDRQGNIRFYTLERSTGSQILDRAAIDMVKRANPVPAVPAEYPPGDLIEFIIVVKFYFK